MKLIIKGFYYSLFCLLIVTAITVDGFEFEIDSVSSVPVGPKNATDWDPAGESVINLPISECGAADTVNQTDFAELRYLDMLPPCEETSRKGYCGIRRYSNITLISKFVTKSVNEQFRVRVHIVDKTFGFETAVWPEFSACSPFFNVTCPQEQQGLVHSFVHSQIPKEIPSVVTILRVRLVSVNENKEKNVAICRQINLHIL